MERSWVSRELELGRHGYDLSYGTLYPALHKMEEEGLLEREDRVEDGRVRGSTTPPPRRGSGSSGGCGA
jgi:PadR family transcriptional regulator PadR